MIWRLAGLVIAALLIYAAGQFAWRALTRNGTAGATLSAPALSQTTLRTFEPKPAPAETPVIAATAGPGPASPCGADVRFAGAALANAASVQTAAWSVMGRLETGWEIYAPLTAREIGAACGPETEGFAAALAAWQGSGRLPATGIMDAATLKALNLVWLRRRPFVAASVHGACPAPPPAFRLALATPAEGYGAKPIRLRSAALAAYRRMAAAARAALPGLAGDSQRLTIFSGYRDPAADAARCAKDGDCGTAARANCSAHRTGLALDLYLGAAPGYRPESSADANRLFQARTAAYHWLVANAARFGFVPYPFEPWHWEWTGEAP